MFQQIIIVLLGVAALTSGDGSFADDFEAAGKDKDSVLEGDLLLEDIVRILGSNYSGDELRRSFKQDLPELEEAIRPMVATLPLNDNQKLSPAAVRYTLHRLLVKQHGWTFSGLGNEGQAWNSSSPTDVILLEKMPVDIREIVEARLQGPGLVIREIAVLASVLEHLVHMETVTRFRAVYKRLRLPANGTTSAAVAQHAIEVYMAAYILGRDPSAMSLQELLIQHQTIHKRYPTWPMAQQWMRDVVEQAVPANTTAVQISDATRAIEELGRTYWKMHGTQCQYMKRTLLKMEDRGTGRLRLQDFYGMNLHMGKWQFAESIPYLKELGALDDSNPHNLRVVVPNYVNGLSNCIASSNYYSVCCISECETILGHLENTLAAAEASPQDITNLIANLPSSTVSKPFVSELMHHRLNAIAANGPARMVPLHGRLFAQWLHHVYPRECSYPHLSGTTSPTQLEDWMNETGLEPTASIEEMQKYAGATKAEWESEVNFTGPIEAPAWSYEEELFVPSPHLTEQHPFELHAALHGLTFAAVFAIISVFSIGFRTAKTARKALRDSSQGPPSGKNDNDRFYMV